ncbi:MAG: hypothetical protein ACREGH_01225 [Minisyncoccia bacterium]
MKTKESERERAILLRRSGYTYRQILVEIPVAKSTLSVWLRSVSLSKRQRQKIAQKRLDAGLRGAYMRKQARISNSAALIQEASKQVPTLRTRELWLIGVALYWAEGSKEKEYYPGSRVQLGNSDPNMLRFFRQWLLQCAKVREEDLIYELYIHESSRRRLKEVKQCWSKRLAIPISELNRVYFKKNKKASNRKNTKNGYYGLVRITVRGSSRLNRKIQGWINGINTQHWGIV